jgi:NTE family protein
MNLEPRQSQAKSGPTEHASPLANWPRPLAFVFSGGGAYGATQVGMIRALVEAGITPDLVVGTSVGALNGAMFAANPSLAADRLTEVWGSMKARGVFGGRTRFGTALSMIRHGLMRNRPGLASSDALRALIEEKMPVSAIEKLPIRTAIVASDAQLGRAKLLTTGPLAPALLASAAIPGVFPPVTINGCIYVDGGVTANVPIRQAIGYGAKSVVVLDATPATLPPMHSHSTVASVFQASMIMLRNQRADAVDHLVGRHPILHLPQSTPATQSSFEFDNSIPLIDAGYEAAREYLARLPILTDTTVATSTSADTASADTASDSATGNGPRDPARTVPGPDSPEAGADGESRPPHSAWPPPPGTDITL